MKAEGEFEWVWKSVGFRICKKTVGIRQNLDSNSVTSVIRSSDDSLAIFSVNLRRPVFFLLPFVLEQNLSLNQQCHSTEVNWRTDPNQRKITYRPHLFLILCQTPDRRYTAPYRSHPFSFLIPCQTSERRYVAPYTTAFSILKTTIKFIEVKQTVVSNEPWSQRVTLCPALTTTTTLQGCCRNLHAVSRKHEVKKQSGRHPNYLL